MQIDILQILGYVAPLVWKVLGAIVIWFVGGWVVNALGRALNRGFIQRKMDPTLARYVEAGAMVVLRVLLIIAMLGVLGVETTSFAALLAAAGFAIGAAWGGLLANFAAGVFLVFLRPFKVGDYISAASETGTVMEIGLFATIVETSEKARVFIGNNTIFSSNIVNYSLNPFCRLELTAQIAHDVSPVDAMRRLRAKVEAIPNVTLTPAPVIGILNFNERGAVITVRPFTHIDNYWQVYFDANQAIVEVGAEAGYAVPEQRLVIRNA